MNITITGIASVFIVLFALIDVLGSVPIFLSYLDEDRKLNPFWASLGAFIIMVTFLFLGEWILKLFNVDLGSFAVAGAIVIFIMSLEMIFGVQIFKDDAPGHKSAFVPIVFPLIAGPASFTALLSMRAEYSIFDVLIGLFLNIIFVFIVLSNLHNVERLIGQGGVYVLRKFFGIILMALSVRLFTYNLEGLLTSISAH